jgi:DNA-binding NarL/FixJ family response regulator
VFGEPLQQPVEVGAGELPVEWAGGRVVAVFEGEYLAGEGAEAGEVVGDQQLALEDGEVDLCLVLAAAALAEGDNPLTPRERDVLAASADGSMISEIAAKLYLSEGTVRNYLSACIQKTGARNRTEALRIAEDRGWLDL